MQLKHNLLSILMLALASTLLIFTACEDEDDDPVTDDPTNEGTVADIDGNVYSTVQIGDQVWMAENLKTTTYNDGTPIALLENNADWDYVENDTAWEENTTAAYCWYANDEAQYAEMYGALYNWYAVETGNLCPDGWHVPTDEEWKILEMELGMSQHEADTIEWRGTNEGSKLAGNASLWNDGVLKNDIDFGTGAFTALPGGFRFGAFMGLGSNCIWWTATKRFDFSPYYRRLHSDTSNVERYNGLKMAGRSVRCLKN